MILVHETEVDMSPIIVHSLGSFNLTLYNSIPNPAFYVSWECRIMPNASKLRNVLTKTLILKRNVRVLILRLKHTLICNTLELSISSVVNIGGGQTWA